MILPEIVKAACIGDEFPKRLLELVHDVWKEKSGPNDQCDAILIPIPNKGDLSHETIGDEFHYWMLLERLWPGSFKRGSRN